MSPHQKKKRGQNTTLTRWFLRQTVVGLVVFVAIGLCITGVWYGTRVPALTIDTIVVESGPTIAAEAVREVAENELNESYLALIPKRFVWLYPHTQIKNHIETLEKVSAVHLSVVQGTQLHISVSEHTPYALWCQEEDTSSCMYVTIAGYAFAEAPHLSGGSLYRYVTPNKELVVDTQVADGQVMVDTNWFAERLESVLDFYPHTIIIYSDGRVTYERSDGAQILTAPAYPVEEAFRYLETLLASEDFQHLPESEFQYIDVRFGNKLFVQEEAVETASSTADTATSTADTTVSEGDSGESVVDVADLETDREED